MRVLVDRLRTNFWFVPSTMAAAATVLSYLSVHVDARISADTVEKYGWLYASGPEGARAVLSTVASSMITVAGLTFSLTMLTLQLASAQYGPRLMRNLIRDRGTQDVLGTFVATFVYCLLVLRTVRGTEYEGHVPHLSVALGVLLAVCSLGVLIYFIHHVAHSLRLETVLRVLTTEAKETITRLTPKHSETQNSGSPDSIEQWPPAQDPERQVIACSTGYIQNVKLGDLLDTAADHDLFLTLRRHAGDFVLDGEPLADVRCGATCPDPLPVALRDAFVLGQDRTPTHDLLHSSGRIVEIAQRALSPSVNDPATALYCIDKIKELLFHFLQAGPASSLHCDDHGVPRLSLKSMKLDGYASTIVSGIARYGISDPVVTAAVLALISDLERSSAAGSLPRLMALKQSISVASRDRLVLAYDKSVAGTS